METVQDVILEYLPMNRKNTGQWVNINCPACIHNGEKRPDHRMRGGFHFDVDGSIVYNCFNCGFKTRYQPGNVLPKKMQNLLYWMGVDNNKIKRLTFDTWRFRDLSDDDVKYTSKNVWFPKFDENSIPDKSYNINDLLLSGFDDRNFLDVCDYLVNKRKLDIEKLNLYWCDTKKYGLNRSVIVPFYWKDKTVGWVSRKIDNSAKNKYYGETPSNYIFNNQAMEKLNRKYIVIVEGVFDALSIDCVAALGNKLTTNQIKWLNSYDKEKIVVPDRNKDGSDMVDIALEQNWFVSIPKENDYYPWGRDIKDVDEARQKYGSVYTLKSIIENRTYDKILIKTVKNLILK